MLSTVLGIAAFGLYLIYDINSVRWNRRVPRCFFLAGTLMIAAATVIDLVDAIRCGAFRGTVDGILIGAAALSLAALIYCLFFAIPFNESYTEQTSGRAVCDLGAYALCRHPGILCFFFFYLFLGIAALPCRLLANGMLFACLNLAYAAFQDRYTFPKTFCDYAEYRVTTPFLIPTPKSIRRARCTWIHVHTKEDNL